MPNNFFLLTLNKIDTKETHLGHSRSMFIAPADFKIFVIFMELNVISN